MLKDYEYYKKDHYEKEIANLNRWFGHIEKTISSPIERIAFMHLVFLSNDVFGPDELHITPQAKIGQYRADFLVSHRETDTWIIVECDGHDFHERTKEQAANDKRRDRFFAKQGYIVLRYTGAQVCSNPMEIYDDVGTIILEKTVRRNGGGRVGGEEDGKQGNQHLEEVQHQAE